MPLQRVPRDPGPPKEFRKEQKAQEELLATLKELLERIKETKNLMEEIKSILRSS